VFISRLIIKNFLIHRSTEIQLDQLNVFVGPNGSGKSALFDALINFSMVARGNIRQAFNTFPFSYAATKFHGASKAARIGFKIGFKQSSDAKDELRYEVEYEQVGSVEGGNPKFGTLKKGFFLPTMALIGCFLTGQIPTILCLSPQGTLSLIEVFLRPQDLPACVVRVKRSIPSLTR
jgi:energy-coupling factor transporter ATP-binding protein EcfA2